MVGLSAEREEVVMRSGGRISWNVDFFLGFLLDVCVDDGSESDDRTTVDESSLNGERS